MIGHRKTAAGVVAAGVAVVGLLIANQAASNTSSSDDSRSSTPETTNAGADVPKGPAVDFCPTAEQVALHDEIYGFDYKPTVACLGDSRAPAPNADQQADAATDPDDKLTRREQCLRVKSLLETATPIHDESRSEVHGRLADGREVIMEVFGDPSTLDGRTIVDEGRDMKC